MAKLFSGNISNGVVDLTLQDEGAGIKTQTIIWHNARGEVSQVMGNVPDDWAPSTTKHIQIGTSCNTIGDRAFEDCTSAQSLTLSKGVTTIGNNAFKNCYNVASPLVLPERIESIGDGSFNNCRNLTGDLYLPPSLKTLGADAFKTCSQLTGGINITDNFTSVSSGAFAGSFQYPMSFNSLTLSNNVTSIGSNAFSYCSNLEGSLNFSDNVTSIGSYAFYYCSALSGSLTLSNSLTTIEDSTFSQCWNLSGNLTIPTTINSIGHRAFHNCTNFSNSLTIPESVTSVGNQAFYNCTRIDDLTITNNLTSIGSEAFAEMKSLSSRLSIPKNTTYTTIEDGTFTYGWGLRGQVNIPDTITSIGNHAFSYLKGIRGCINLLDANNLTSLGDYAFKELNHVIGDLIMPDNVTVIGTGCFHEIYQPGNFDTAPNFNMYDYSDYHEPFPSLPNPELTTEDESAEGRLEQRIVIPESVTSLGKSIFKSQLNTITHPDCDIHCYTPRYVVDRSVDLDTPLTDGVGNTFYEGCFSRIYGQVLYPGLPAFGYDSINRALVLHVKASDSSWVATGPSFDSFPGPVGTFTEWLTANHIPMAVGGHNYVLVIKDLLDDTSTILYSDNNFRMEEIVADIPSSWNINNFINATRVRIGTSCTSIGNNAFSGCTKLTGALTIPSSITSIGDNAFAGCTGLTSAWINCPRSVIPANCFTGSNSITTIHVKSSPETPAGWVTGIQNVGGITVNVVDDWTVRNRAPIVTSIPSQGNNEEDTISLQVSAFDPDGDNLLYSANGLPGGITINETSGLISGTISVGESNGSPFNVVVTVADDNLNSESADITFTWDVSGTGGSSLIETVTVGDPGNADLSLSNGSTAGGVPYTFEMGKYEISRGLVNQYNSESSGPLVTLKDMEGSGIGTSTNGDEYPATGLSWNECARFVNWLNEREGFQPAYRFTTNGYNDSPVRWDTSDALTLSGEDFDLWRNKSAKYFIPTKHEWHKAAYYNGSSYNTYSTGNIAPTAVTSGTDPNTAVYGFSTSQGPGPVAQAGGLSHYGAMGMGGNTWEWNEGIAQSWSGSRFAQFKGWFGSLSQIAASAAAGSSSPTSESQYIGFRVMAIQ